MAQAVLTALAAAAGFVAKSLWDLYWNRRESVASVARQKRLELLERQLSLFYWPLYLHLQKNNVVWDHLVNGTAFDDSLRKAVNAQLYRTFFKENHEIIVRLIESSIHLAQPDPPFEAVLLLFIRHVTVFKALRDMGHEDIDPIALGVPWPGEFFTQVESRLKAVQAQYEREVGWASAAA